MRNLLNADDLFVQICLNYEVDPRLVLIVEGDSDVRSLARHANSECCLVVPGLGKHRILAAMQKFEDHALDISLALVDRDFDNLSGAPVPRNVVRTSLYDRDADVLLQAQLMDDYINSTKDVDREAEFLQVHSSRSVRSLVIESAATIGRVRWSSIRDNLGLSLSSFPVGRILTQALSITVDDVVSLAICRTTAREIDRRIVIQSCSQNINSGLEDLCSGHDLISILAVSSKWWARQAIGRDEIRRSMAFATRCDVLKQLPWFKELAVLAKNRGCRLWRC